MPRGVEPIPAASDIPTLSHNGHASDGLTRTSICMDRSDSEKRPPLAGIRTS